MADLLINLENYLIQNGFAEEDGVDIFRDYRPEDPSNIIVLSEYSGLSSTVGVSAITRSIQLLVRNDHYREARNKAFALYKFLNTPEDPIKWLTEKQWCIILAEQTPYKLELDSRKRTVFVFNIRVTVEI